MKLRAKHSVNSIFAAVAALWILQSPAFAETAEKTGNEIQRIVTGVKVIRTSAATILLMGWGIKQFQSDVFYIGGFAYTGAMASGQLGNYSEGGLSLGYNSPAFGAFDVDAQVSFGGGGGTVQSGSSSTNGGGFIINPSIGLTMALSKSARFALMVGYDFLPNSTTFSGLSVEGQIAFLRF